MTCKLCLLRWKVPPALPWAAGISLGALSANSLSFAPATAACLIALGFALGFRRAMGVVAGSCAVVVGWGLGAAAATVTPGSQELHILDAQRPVEAVVRVVDDPLLGDLGSRRCRVQLDRLRQGSRVVRAGALVHLRLPAAGTDHVLRGATLRLRGYLSRPPALRNLRPAEPGPWRLSVESARFVTVESSPGAVTLGVLGFRRRCREVLEAWPAETAALASTLVLGDRSQLPLRWQRALRAWGLAHLTAVSGLHVGVVALLAYICGLWLPRRPRLALALLAVFSYAWLVGPRPSVLRAAVMALLGLWALFAERPPNAANALAVAVAGLVMWRPSMVLDLGFRLSVGATAGLIYLSLPIARAIASLGERGAGSDSPRRTAPCWWHLSLSSTLAAQVSAGVIAVPIFALIQPTAGLTNLLAVPWLTLALLASIAGMMISAAAPWAMPWAVLPAELCAWSLERLTTIPVGPWVCWPVSVTGWGALGSLLVLGVLGSLLVSLQARFPKALAVAAAAGGLVALLAWLSFQPASAEFEVESELLIAERSTEVEILALDVGQGDAVLLRHVGGASVLIDGGGWRRGDLAARALVPALADLDVSRLAAVVMTHPDVDHCRGLVDLSSYIAIEEVWSGPGWWQKCAAELLGTAGPRWRPLWRGKRVEVGPWSFETLWPPARSGSSRGAASDSANERSLVLRAEALGKRILLTGDIGLETERQLLAMGQELLDADVLKVAHHGSKSSTGDSLLDAVAPQLAVVQAGQGNFYGHPHAAVIRRLSARQVQILRTDHHGLVRVRWHLGGAWRLSTTSSPKESLSGPARAGRIGE